MQSLTRFNKVFLPTAQGESDAGSGGTKQAKYALSGGGLYDAYGDEVAPASGGKSIQHSALLHNVDATERTSDFLELTALRGVRGRLFRTMDSGDIHYMESRVESIEATRKPEDFSKLEMSLNFSRENRAWKGDLHGTWTLDSGEELDAGLALDSGETTILATSPQTIQTINAGNIYANEIMLTITAGSAAITDLEIETDICHLEFSGTINAGESLTINVGALSVENNAVDAYDDFALGANHISEDWMRFPPGTTDIEVTITGGSTDSTFDVNYRETWS